MRIACLLIVVAAMAGTASAHKVKVYGRQPLHSWDSDNLPVRFSQLSHGLYVVNGKDGRARIRQKGSPKLAAVVTDPAITRVTDYVFTEGGKMVERASLGQVGSRGYDLPSVSALVLVGRNVHRLSWWFEPRFASIGGIIPSELVGSFEEDVDALELRPTPTELRLGGLRRGSPVKTQLVIKPAQDGGRLEKPMEVDELPPDPTDD